MLLIDILRLSRFTAHNGGKAVGRKGEKIMNKLNVNSKLLLLTVHSKHIRTMSPVEKEKHSLENIIKVIVDQKINV